MLGSLKSRRGSNEKSRQGSYVLVKKKDDRIGKELQISV